MRVQVKTRIKRLKRNCPAGTAFSLNSADIEGTSAGDIHAELCRQIAVDLFVPVRMDS